MQLARRLRWQFRDADDFHSAANVQKMRSGVSLTDDDRLPWLAALNAQMRKYAFFRLLLTRSKQRATGGATSRPRRSLPALHCERPIVRL